MLREITLADYETAEAHVRASEGRVGVYVHAALYVLVNILLLAINLVVMPGFLWCLFPLVGWGLGLLIHYLFAMHFVHRQTAVYQAIVEHQARQLHPYVIDAD